MGFPVFWILCCEFIFSFNFIVFKKNEEYNIEYLYLNFALCSFLLFTLDQNLGPFDWALLQILRKFRKLEWFSSAYKRQHHREIDTGYQNNIMLITFYNLRCMPAASSTKINPDQNISVAPVVNNIFKIDNQVLGRHQFITEHFNIFNRPYNLFCGVKQGSS